MKRLMLLLWFVTVPAIAAAQQSETVEYYGHDVIGSIRIVWDVSGSAISRNDYAPFGRALSSSSTMPKEGFVGQETAAEADQAYLHARMLAVRTGRFSSADSAPPDFRNPQRWNRYAYSLNNPVAFSDPSGLNAIASEGNPDFCSAEYSFDDCGGDWLFWNFSGGGGGGFGGGYAAAINAGYRPDMPDDIWSGLQQWNQNVQTQIDAKLANIAVSNGDWSTANDIVNRNPDLEYGIVPVLTGSFASFQDEVTSYLKGLGVWDHVIQEEWAGDGYRLTLDNVRTVSSQLANDPRFASGHLGLLHVGDVGFPNQDFRSLAFPTAPHSLQVTIGPDGRVWADVDRYNPYQTLASFMGHAFVEVLNLGPHR